MYTCTADTGRELMLTAGLDVLFEGLTQYPRGLETLELRPALLRLTNPYDALSTQINRVGLSAEVAALEALQLIAGESCPELLFAAAPSFRKFFNHDEDHFDGAYGPRIRDQLPTAVRRLQKDPHTRQAVVTIYDEADLIREQSRDYPCTLSLHFMIRDEKLCLHTTMRSNDIWLGFPYDIFQFTQLQISVANTLNVAVGDYTHLANSLHVYEPNYEAVDELGFDRFEDDGTSYASPTEPFHNPFGIRGVGRLGMPIHQIQNRAHLILAGREDLLNDGPTLSEDWYVKQLESVIRKAVAA